MGVATLPLFYSVTLFISAFLLFLVQPLIGKMLLPQLGGTPAVWNSCMVFFQAMLLGGYLYAHHSTTRFDLKRQTTIQIGLLVATLVVFGITAVLTGGPIAVVSSLSPQGASNPFFGMMLLLLLAVGLPFFTVSASAPLLQKWFANTGHPSARDPYFLYAASNAGSLSSLVFYPAIIEPNLRLATQNWLWVGAFAGLAGLTAVCGSFALKAKPPAAKGSAGARVPISKPTVVETPLTWSRRLRWLGLAFVPSSLMLGLTSYLSTDIASFPLLWVIPLGIYLITFIIAFARLPNWLFTGISLVAPVAILLLVFLLVSGLRQLQHHHLLAVHLVVFLAAALMCHCDLAKSRPSTSHLTEFYLWLSVGGVLGGLFNALLAPMIFNDIYEYKIALVIACLMIPFLSEPKYRPSQVALDLLVPTALLLLTLWLNWNRELSSESSLMRTLGSVVTWLQGKTWMLALWLSEHVGTKAINIHAVFNYGIPTMICYAFIERPLRFGLCVGAVMLASVMSEHRSGVLMQERSFFGVMHVDEATEGNLLMHKLVHGTTLHGKQIRGYVIDGQRYEAPSNQPITYYHHDGPIGDLFAQFSGPRKKTNVAVIGLGSGSLSGHMEAGQNLTIFEIDPLVKRMAENPDYFSFLKETPAKYQIVLGDARIQLERQRDAKYGMILVDAFSSDSIPVHLLTREALQLYLSRMEDDGVLVLHISNRYLRLEWVVAKLAQELKLEARAFYDYENEEVYPTKSGSNWVVLARKAEHLGRLAAAEGGRGPDRPSYGILAGGPAFLAVPKLRWQTLKAPPEAPLFTDDFSNLVGIIRWWTKDDE
jgi:hypothetical protein